MLLHWCTVSPQGQDNIAAIRFAYPVRISSICVFPTGTHPFVNAPDVVAKTEPEAFYLELFLNAHPIPQADTKEKPRPANALIPTVIAYAGGQVDFTVDMGSDYATRLMILKGKFDVLSMAIYGEIVADTPSPTQNYEAKPLPPIEHTTLSKAVDPSISSDPTTLAKRLLDLIPNSPPLSLVVRLMFCLKPSDADWDSPEFPYLHADLEHEVDVEPSLETVMDLLSKPVRDDASEEDLEAFALRVSGCLSTPKDNNHAYQIAELLSLSASQHPSLARALLDLDKKTLLCLLDAVTNADIARQMSNETFLKNLASLQETSRTDTYTQFAARRLASRIRDWTCFEDALSNTRGGFNQSWNMLKEIAAEEQSMGIWLESVILHEDIVTKLAENPVLANLQSHAPF
ncbi:hypothetical protein H0H81_006316 [Sphagnurus paluster]|uniref:Virilizer N-terminal domain-containing protein n=1 Tax=Sphagnurus paluster TaxID=117069 RepID=A0A9P7KM01_9AGAR|nr:hypothetical protein H0H81_006316 [Sphagnurus paluster]